MFTVQRDSANRTSRRERKRATQSVMKVQKSLEVDYPEHLGNVNYLALDQFEAAIDDPVVHKAYHQAIMENQHLFVKKIVLHITQGANCLYSLFAAQSGSLKVYCVVNGGGQAEAQNLYMIREIIKENNLEDRIQAVCWSNFNAQVDIIVAEPMGYCLHFDGLLDRIIQARDLYLVKEGIVFPKLLSFKCALIHDQHFSDHKVNYWDDVYGVPMHSIKKWISHEPVIRTIDPSLVTSKVAKLLTFNLETITYEQVIKLDKIFDVDPLPECKANGIAFWFQVIFAHCTQKKDIKASPWVDSTKYTHVTLYWPQVVQVSQKTKVRLKGQKFPKEGYSVVSTAINGKVYQYSFS